MFKKYFIIASALSISSIAMAQDEVALDTDDARYSYSVGNRIGQQLMVQFSQQGLGVDMEILRKALNDVMTGEPSLMNDSEIQAAIELQQAKQLEMASKVAETNLAEGEAYRAENRAKEGVMETESGLQYTVIESGEGDKMPGPDDTVVVHYAGTLIDGTEFDSSYSRGNPAEFPLTSIISGWKEILQLMTPGDKWSVVIPPQMGYGERGSSSIGPNETLVFEIHLLEIK